MVRYKKRYGKEGAARKPQDSSDLIPDDAPGRVDQLTVKEVGSTRTNLASRSPNAKTTKPYAKKVDARTIKPGAALASAPRLTGAIVQSQGQKISFD